MAAKSVLGATLATLKLALFDAPCHEGINEDADRKKKTQYEKNCLPRWQLPDACHDTFSGCKYLTVDGARYAGIYLFMNRLIATYSAVARP
jgi:hypothetical protein